MTEQYRKRDNLMRQLKSKLKHGSRYENVLFEKIDWIRSLKIKIVLVTGRNAIIQEKICFGGKVVWEKGANPKKPLILFLNVIDFEDAEFVTILLHECGHIKDKDNSRIELETLESEISAWQHALDDFKSMEPDKFEKYIFIDVMKRGLKSYKVHDADIERLKAILC